MPEFLFRSMPGIQFTEGNHGKCHRAGSGTKVQCQKQAWL